MPIKELHHPDWRWTNKMLYNSVSWHAFICILWDQLTRRSADQTAHLGPVCCVCNVFFLLHRRLVRMGKTFFPTSLKISSTKCIHAITISIFLHITSVLRCHHTMQQHCSILFRKHTWNTDVLIISFYSITHYHFPKTTEVMQCTSDGI